MKRNRLKNPVFQFKLDYPKYKPNVQRKAGRTEEAEFMVLQTLVEYLNIFNALPKLLENVPDNIKHSMWYQHCAKDVRNFLNDEFSIRWMV